MAPTHEDEMKEALIDGTKPGEPGPDDFYATMERLRSQEAEYHQQAIDSLKKMNDNLSRVADAFAEILHYGLHTR